MDLIPLVLKIADVPLSERCLFPWASLLLFHFIIELLHGNAAPCAPSKSVHAELFLLRHYMQWFLCAVGTNALEVKADSRAAWFLYRKSPRIEIIFHEALLFITRSRRHGFFWGKFCRKRLFTRLEMISIVWHPPVICTKHMHIAFDKIVKFVKTLRTEFKSEPVCIICLQSHIVWGEDRE